MELTCLLCMLWNLAKSDTEAVWNQDPYLQKHILKLTVVYILNKMKG